jgi:hypothetical protein
VPGALLNFARTDRFDYAREDRVDALEVLSDRVWFAIRQRYAPAGFALDDARARYRATFRNRQ